jgi:hypothetical protein
MPAVLLEHAAIQVVQSPVFAAPQESGIGPLPLAAILFAARKSVAIRERPDIATGRSTLTAAAHREQCRRAFGSSGVEDCRTRPVRRSPTQENYTAPEFQETVGGLAPTVRALTPDLWPQEP